MMTAARKVTLTLGLWVLAACSAPSSSDDTQRSEVLVLPEGFPQPSISEDNPLTSEKIELGRHLFYDQRLSANEEQSCASCHEQERAFSDGRTLAVGSTGQEHARNSPGLTNVAYNATLTWANPVLTKLEQQILVPLFGEHPIELGAGSAKSEILERIEQDEMYESLFKAAYPAHDAPVSWDHIAGSLASFCRALISGNAPFDQFVYQGHDDALSEQALRGMDLFYSERLECHHCHGGFNFTESSIHEGSAFDAQLFHNTGLYDIDGEGAYPKNNTGLFEITGSPADMGKFRPPTLRNVSVTAPYMHDGSIETLEEVIAFYEAGGRKVDSGPYAGDGRASPLKSGLVAGFSLDEGERADLVAFLESLTDSDFLSNPRFANPFEE